MIENNEKDFYIVNSLVCGSKNSYVQKAYISKKECLVIFKCENEEKAKLLNDRIYVAQQIASTRNEENKMLNHSDFKFVQNKNFISISTSIKEIIDFMKKESILSGWFIRDILKNKDIVSLTHCNDSHAEHSAFFSNSLTSTSNSNFTLPSNDNKIINGNGKNIIL